MKIGLSIIKAAALVCWLFAGSAVAQQAGEVVTRGPGVQGSQEYIFQSHAPKGALVVFRRDAYLDDKLIDRYEVISKTPISAPLKKIVSINSNGIKVDDGNMCLPTAFTQKTVAFHSEPACVKTVFEGVRKKRTWAVTYIFTMKNELSEDVLRRVPATVSSQIGKLERIGADGWTASVDYSNKSYPMSTALGELD